MDEYFRDHRGYSEFWPMQAKVAFLVNEAKLCEQKIKEINTQLKD